jgi:ADP-ribosylglycohydrolase
MKAETKYKGALKLAAIGDALGWMTEFENSAESLKSKFGVTEIDTFYSWEKKVGGRFNGYIDKINAGSYSDDTQLLLCVSRSIKPNGLVDNVYFSKSELPAWLQYSRGAGRTIKNAAEKIERKSASWYSNFFSYKVGDTTIDYRQSGANGAAMRILPIVLANFRDFEIIKREVFANSIITHGHSRALIGALLMAYAIDTILPMTPADFDPEKFIIEIGQDFHKKFELPFLNEPGFSSWISEWNNGSTISFQEQYQKTLNETHEQLRILYKEITSKQPIINTLSQLGCVSKETKGSGIATVLAGIFLTCKYHATPTDGVLFAVNYLGSDTDSIAAFTGALLGSLHGQSIIPEKWTRVQDFEYLDKIAIDLLSISEHSFTPRERNWNMSLNELDTTRDIFALGETVYFEPLGEGKISKIERQLPLTKGRYILLIDIDFKIGQSCRFSKLISGVMPKALNEKELITLIHDKVVQSKQDSIIKEITEKRNTELNELIILVLRSLA